MVKQAEKPSATDRPTSDPHQGGSSLAWHRSLFFHYAGNLVEHRSAFNLSPERIGQSSLQDGPLATPLKALRTFSLGSLHSNQTTLPFPLLP